MLNVAFFLASSIVENLQKKKHDSLMEIWYIFLQKSTDLVDPDCNQG